MTTSVYREMAFKVHPDVSDIKNATELMKEVNANKSNPVELIKLAAKWGIDIEIPAEYKDIFERAKNAKTHASFSKKESERIYEAVVNSIVKWHYKYRFKWYRGYGVVSKVRKITKGKYTGYTEWTVMDLISGTEKKVKALYSPFTVVKMATPDVIERAKELVLRDKERKRNNKEAKKERYEKYFKNVGLKPNYNYENHDYEVLVNFSYGARWRKLHKTTNFCVYHTSGNRVRRTDLKFILDARKVEKHDYGYH